jgi:hypothetical protein
MTSQHKITKKKISCQEVFDEEFSHAGLSKPNRVKLAERFIIKPFDPS